MNGEESVFLFLQSVHLNWLEIADLANFTINTSSLNTLSCVSYNLILCLL